MIRGLKGLSGVAAAVVGFCLLGVSQTSQAALHNVNIGDYFFSPANLTINLNDDVSWTWIGVIPHSTTGTNGLWDSGIHNTGASFTNSFNTAGSFPFLCTVHPTTMLGAIDVQSASTPAMTNVTIGDFFFSPTSVTIKAGDSVKWSWVGAIPHSTTSTNGLWDSGLHTSGFAYTNTFNSAGSFPYLCTLHALSMRATVVVQGSPDVPPTVAISSPKSNSTFAAPYAPTIQATAADADGVVAKVEVLAGTNRVGSITSPPLFFSLSLSNLDAGSYSLTAVATDNNGVNTTSRPVALKLIAPASIVLSSPERVVGSGFRLSYTADPGLSYSILRSSGLPDWTSISTNTATTNVVTFLDTAAPGDLNLYRVWLQPDP